MDFIERGIVMKKTIIKVITVLLVFVLMSLPLYSNLYAVEPENKAIVNSQKVMEARFLNMLNNNYVYSEAFDSLEDIVNDSVIALLDSREGENESYISQTTVNEYLYDMFGFKVYDYSEINKDFPYMEGYVYILPRGYAKYEHSAVSITENEDGTFTFISDVKIKTHDGYESTNRAKTLFVKNSDSVFGYNIVVSDIYEIGTNSYA